MTIAVCPRCGESKYGAFTPCEACRDQPQSETDLVDSLALSSHHFSFEQLDAISTKIKAARAAEKLPPRVEMSADTRDKLLAAANEAKRMLGLARNAPEPTRRQGLITAIRALFSRGVS